MKAIFTILAILMIGTSTDQPVKNGMIGKFDISKDLLLVHYDCKTDVDDIHTVAAMATILRQKTLDKIKFHAVVGTYGTQEGLYVPANEIFELAFSGRWSDAHQDFDKALETVALTTINVLKNDGDIWIGEAGQSDFSATLVAKIKEEMPQVNTNERFHIVQHSNWNEEVTSADKLQYLINNADYLKIPDGNIVGNGTPGFRSEESIKLLSKIDDDELTQIWNLAVELANRYNGVDGRYKNNAIANNGLDFSDLSEVCWIFGINDISDVNDFFDRFRAK